MGKEQSDISEYQVQIVKVNCNIYNRQDWHILDSMISTSMILICF